jgi:muconolactone delta-isomerase
MKVLAVSHNSADPTPQVEDELRRVAELQRSGVIEEIWLKADRSGAVVVLDCDDADDARRQLSTLPLVENGVTSFDVTELVPIPTEGDEK